ncbi:MAG: hypothetical protein K5886_03885 [Lachnospiraceae bacterium]|nr:hypothetical protein [Lachnospiraceae bacterium]
MKRNIKRTALKAAVLLSLALSAGSLCSCGLASFFDNETKTATKDPDPFIVESRNEEIDEYYAGNEGGVIVQTGELTQYKINVLSNSDDRGTVEYMTTQGEKGKTVTAVASPREGCVLDHWMVNGEEAAALGKETEVSVYDVTEDMTLVAVFAGEPEQMPILQVSPSNIPVGNNPQGGDDVQYGNFQVITLVNAGEEHMGTVGGGLNSDTSQPVQINATPKPGYVFSYWNIVTDYWKGEGQTGDHDGAGWSENYTVYSSSYTVYLNRDDRKSAKAVCTAYFTEQYPNPKVTVVTKSPTDSAGKVANGNAVLPLGTETALDKTKNIVISANTGYLVDHAYYVTVDGVTHDFYPTDTVVTGASTITIPTANITEDVFLHVEYKKDKYIVKVMDDPVVGGTSTITEYDHTVATPLGTYTGHAEITSGNKVEIISTPAAGYVFDCFVDSSGTKISGIPDGMNNYVLTIDRVNSDETITARYTKDDVTVSIEPSPGEGGTVQYSSDSQTGTSPVSVKTDYIFHPGTETGFTLTAEANDGYTFQCWEDSAGNAFSTKVVRISALKEDRTYTAVFVKDKEDITVTIEPSPAEGGTVRYNNEAPVSASTQYTYHPLTETGFTLTATPGTGYTFEYWQDSQGNVFNTQQIRISNLREDRTYTAVFKSEDEKKDEKGLRVVAEPPSGGHVRKKPSETDPGKVELTAYPNKGWKFTGWKKEGGLIFSKNKKVTVNDESVTYVGCFIKDKDYRPTTGITDEHFYDEKRRVTHPSYSVTRQTMENLAAVNVAYDRIRNANDLPALHGYGAVASVRKYFENKLSDSEIKFVEGILTTTDGEFIGIDNIQDIGALMNSAREITLKKFGDRYDSEIVAAVYTDPPADFDGQVRTYLWRETGTDQKDNIYVMYRDKGSEYREMAAVTDEDGTVRFTLEDTLIGTEFALVRVNIEERDQMITEEF